MALITLNKLALPTGSVVQVVQSIDVTNRTITSTSLASTGISLSITPSSSSNKIL